MGERVVILTEESLQPSDVSQIVGLFGKDLVGQVLVPIPDDEHPLSEALDHLLLTEWRAAWDAATHRGPTPNGSAEAASYLRESLAELRSAGVTADGAIVPGDPIAALVQTINTFKATQVVVVTRPHLASDTLHEDWASKARHTLGVPVIHFYSGTTKLLD
jgi:hypothetical protein